MKWLPLILLVLLLVGCAYGPTDIVKEPVYCSCGAQTWIECQAQYVLMTCMTTKCRSCGKYLANGGDEVYMNGLLPNGIHVKRMGGH